MEQQSPAAEAQDPSAIRKGYAEVNDIRLYYEDGGAGEVMVFIPGLGGNTELWRHQADYFRRHFRVIVLDNRGAGHSDKPQPPYSMSLFASDLLGLLDHLGVSEPVHLVGASMGGVIAQAFIHAYPARVKTLSLVCTGVSTADPHITWPDAEVSAKLINPGRTREEAVSTMLNLFFHPDFVRANPDLPRQYLERKGAEQPGYAYQAQLAAIADPYPYYQWLGEITVPTLVIHGENDLIWPVENARTLARGIGERARLRVMPKAGHVLFQERPDEFNAHLHDFIKEAKA